ncbi:lytic transglycosylase domain-containing protein [Lentilitoribacter sp. Alg239-R112]|uniref:lytic transglycosylase domain-containing protein n=1 Tax=Lentilitoribacter sp. Alg239-R112 TaxID=2305987 RepID=UPI001FCE655A|nr:lytic transglycosylase domain-containing protein [Lentilitoribacter sp. Alg239-R112]
MYSQKLGKAAFIIAMLATCASYANPLPPADIPVPVLRDQNAIIAPTTTDAQITGAIVKSSFVPAVSGSLQSGLDALGKKDQNRARAIRNGMRKNSQDRHILTWAISQSGLNDIPSSEIAMAMAELKSWPGLTTLRYRWEKALLKENPPANTVIAAFGNAKPKTAEGAIILTRALKSKGRKKNARTVLLPFWHNERLDKKEENLILKEFSSLLSKANHKRRMDMLLYRDRVTQAERFSKLAGAESLYRARAATIRKQPKADKLIKSVHRSWRKDPSYLFTKIERARREERFNEVAKLIVKAPRDPNSLINPGEWWVEQRIVSRILYERGNASAAYKIAANHLAVSERDRIEAEFHAGFFALRGLKKPNTAIKHFSKILDYATTPKSKSRAWYWLGRSAEAKKSKKASEYYRHASQYPTAYYGQLASAKLNIKNLNVRYPKPSSADRRNFASRDYVQAIKKLEISGHAWRSDRLYRAAAQQLTSPGELALLAAMAEKRGNYQLALQVGKIGYRRGLDVAALAFPLGAIPKKANISGTGTALAYSIARQESTFNKAAISPANARGLLQLLPATAKTVARTYGLKYSKSRLTTDAAYNATLGAHFLNEQIANFNGSYIMTFIGYNAGPRRVPQWIARFGNPQGKSIEHVVDWVEMIPYTETRNYVQRVIENYQVYKTRLGQKANIIKDLRFGR